MKVQTAIKVQTLKRLLRLPRAGLTLKAALGIPEYAVEDRELFRVFRARLQAAALAELVASFKLRLQPIQLNLCAHTGEVVAVHFNA